MAAEKFAVAADPTIVPPLLMAAGLQNSAPGRQGRVANAPFQKTIPKERGETVRAPTISSKSLMLEGKAAVVPGGTPRFFHLTPGHRTSEPAPLEYRPTETLPPLGANADRPGISAGPTAPLGQRTPAQNPGCSTYEGRYPRDPDWLAEGDGFEPSVPRAGQHLPRPAVRAFGAHPPRERRSAPPKRKGRSGGAPHRFCTPSTRHQAAGLALSGRRYWI